MMQNELENKIKGILDAMYWDGCNPDGTYTYEMYADYDDLLDDNTIGKIVSALDPETALYEYLNEAYFDARMYYEDEITKDILGKLGMDAKEVEEILGAELRDWIIDRVFYEAPVDHFLKQEVNVNIMIDTGDCNYDFTLNSVYPGYYGRQGNAHHKRAAIDWLAQQQGYSRGEFRKALEADTKATSKFLESMRMELLNTCSGINVMTFNVSMTIEKLIELNKLIRLQDRNGHKYDGVSKPYCGYIIIDKSAHLGLFDPFNGAGSLLEVELEKDVRLPIKYIDSALPDGFRGQYGIGSTYGLDGSWWTDTVKQIVVPKKADNMLLNMILAANAG